ncbi:MAG TPA: polysaccharide biosynthesis tyrosine autokinase [Anaerolineae bacterium]|nr:polysaccharide biosynthesis tyrosine autokinase [Anaerolineae bacterium]
MVEKSYFAMLWHRKWLIAATTVATVLVVLVGMLLVTPLYEASAKLRVFTAARGSVDWVDYDIAYTERLMNTYSQLATSQPVLQELAQQLNLGSLPEISAGVVADTELMEINVEGADPVLVTAVANGLAQILVARSEDYAGGGRTAQDILSEQLTQAEEELAEAQTGYAEALGQTPQDSARIAAMSRSVDLKQEVYTALLQQYERTRVAEELRSNSLSIVEPATLPGAPSKPNRMANLLLGALVGLVAGSGLALLFERLDTRVQSTEEIEETTGLPTLGRIPFVRKGPAHVFLGEAIPAQEAYHRLQAKLEARIQADGSRSILVTSPEPGEGKSAIVANLAQALANAGRRVIVVDANLRQPVMHEILDVSNKVGLSNVLTQEWTVKEAVQTTRVRGLWVLTSGTAHPNPAMLLNSPGMQGLLEELTHPFDVIVVDTPPVLAVSDATLLAPMVDGVLLAVGRAQSKRESIEAAIELLEGVQATLLGVVVNWAERTKDLRHYRGYQRAAKPASVPQAGPRVTTRPVAAPSVPQETVFAGAGQRPDQGRDEPLS